jgi:hypothetical protein
MKVCRNCGWCKGKTEIGALWCDFKETMVFETDKACDNFSTERRQSIRWVSYNELGSSNLKETQELCVYENKPFLSKHCYKDIEAKSGCHSLCVLHDWEDENDTMCFAESLLPMLHEIRGTNKLLKITIEMVDPC